VEYISVSLLGHLSYIYDMGIIPDIDPRGPPHIPDWWDREEYEDEYDD